MVAAVRYLAAAAPVRAADCAPNPPAGTPSAAAAAIEDRVVAAWLPNLQHRDGSFADYVARPSEDKRDHYGPAMLGAALVLYGLRTCRPTVTHAGLRAIDWATKHLPLRNGKLRTIVAFENVALAVAYEEASDRLAGDAVYAQVRRDWEGRLRHMRYEVYGHHRAFYNWYLVETLTVAALLRSGLHSTVPGAILTHPEAARARITNYLNTTVLQSAMFQITHFGDQEVLLLSDAPDNPPAYHEFSLALFSKSVALLGPDAETSARDVLDRMGRATWALMAPDGDVSWFGRSQEQSWTLAMAAAGLLTTSRVKGIDPPDAERLRAAAARALLRLSSPDYVSARFGLWIAPAFTSASIGAARPGLDPYAAAASYTGLTMLGLEWVAEDLNGALPTPSVGIGADEAVLGLRLGHTPGSFIVLRKGPVWMSVKQAPASKSAYSKDLRYGEGLNGLEVLRGGVWDRILPPRPKTAADEAQPAGPVVRVGRAIGRPVGHALRVVGEEIVMQVDYETTSGRRVALSRKVQYQPTACGVQLSFRAFPNEEWIYSVFFSGGVHRVGPDAVADSTQAVSARGPHVSLAPSPGSFRSGQHARLFRWRVETGHAHGAYVSFTVCASGLPTP